METILFGYGIGKYSIDRFSIDLKGSRTLITFLEMKPTVLDDSFKFVILDAGGALEHEDVAK
jgi:hypothetical protein